jgi:hypothetical protein
MIDTLRTDFPTDMVRASENSGMGTLDTVAENVVDQLKDYARAHPTAFGLWALGIGFVLGWKLKPW